LGQCSLISSVLVLKFGVQITEKLIPIQVLALKLFAFDDHYRTSAYCIWIGYSLGLFIVRKFGCWSLKAAFQGFLCVTVIPR